MKDNLDYGLGVFGVLFGIYFLVLGTLYDSYSFFFASIVGTSAGGFLLK